MGYLHHRLLATSCAHPKSSWPKSKIFVHLKMHTSWLQSPQNPRTRRRTPCEPSRPENFFVVAHRLNISSENCSRRFARNDVGFWDKFRDSSLDTLSHNPQIGVRNFATKNGLASTKWRVVPQGWMKPQPVEVPNFETLIQVLNSFHWLQDVSEWQSMSHCRGPRLLVG